MILNKLVLVSNINQDISDNSTGAISPYDIRHNLLDIIDSVHLLTSGENIVSRNFGSIATRSTRAGYETLSKFGLDNYTSIDNSAFGYHALKSNYRGSRNTALGSTSLSCNIYGSDNTGAGYSSLAGNTTGFGNIGVGSYALSKNRTGNWNIALGHAAGYYAKDVSSKLFIASHPIDDQHICDNPEGSGWRPLVYGDLDKNTLRFGIATPTLHDFGTLQVSGAISPSLHDAYNLGHPSASFKHLYLTNSIKIGSSSLSFASGQIYSSSNLTPSNSNSYLGTSYQRWSKGYFNSLITNYFTATQKAHYLHHTIYLASSGYIDTLDGGGAYSLYDYSPSPEETTHPNGYLPDEDLLGAGLVLRSIDKQFEFLFHPHNSGNFAINCYEEENDYSSSHWSSNVSLHIDSGCHVLTSRVIGYGDTLSLTTNSGCVGIYLDSGRDILVGDEYWLDNKSEIAGLGNFNVITSGESDYTVSIISPESGVTITQNFLSYAKNRVIDIINNKEKLQGYSLQYINDEQVLGAPSDRFCINAFNNTSTPVNSLILLKDTVGGNGFCGINDLGSDSQNFLPATTLNVRSEFNGTIRISSENSIPSQTSLQLVGNNNCLENGFEIQYVYPSGYTDFNIVKDSGSTTVLRVNDNNTLDIFATSGTQHDDMITIGDAIHSNVFVAVYEGSGIPASGESYGKIFVNKKDADPTQSSTLKYMDSSGNIFDIALNKYDSNSNLLFTDNLANTFAGINCNADRSGVSPSLGNTAIGFSGLYDIAGGNYNVGIGAYALSDITTGSYNIGIGSNVLSDVTDQSISNNIVISTQGISNISSDYNFCLGVNDNVVLLSGSMGPLNSDKYLYMPDGGRFSLLNGGNNNQLLLESNNIEVIDQTGNTYPQNSLSFSFTADSTNDLLILNHANAPISTTPSYAASTNPFAELKGDLRLLGDIKFSDGTSMDTYSDVTALISSVMEIFDAISGVNNILETLIVEGTSLERIAPASNIESPSTGTINLRNGSNVVITNRDKYTEIRKNEYIIAIKIGSEYRPIWIGGDSLLPCCDS